MSQVAVELTTKERARRLVDRLPDDATWRDLQDEVFIRQQIERARQDVAAGRTFTQAEVFGHRVADPA